MYATYNTSELSVFNNLTCLYYTKKVGFFLPDCIHVESAIKVHQIKR